MSEALPERIDLMQAARNHRHYEGVVDIAKMHRLSQSLASNEGQISVSVDLGIDEHNHPVLSGEASGQVWLQCQRCLEPMQAQIDISYHLALVRSEAEMDAMPEELDPLLIEDQNSSLIDIVEDELILGLPLVSSHDQQECTGSQYLQDGQAATETEQVDNPFAVLKDLKIDE